MGVNSWSPFARRVPTTAAVTSSSRGQRHSENYTRHKQGQLPPDSPDSPITAGTVCLGDATSISELMTSTPPWVFAVRTGHNLSDVRHATVPISGVRMNPSSPSSNRAGSTLWPRALATRPSTLDAATSRPSHQVPIPSMLTPGTRDAHSTLTLSLAIARRISWS